MLILVENPKHSQPLNDADIFYQKSFFDLHAHLPGAVYLGLANNSPQNLIGAVQLRIDDASQVKSPARGTYGGIYLLPRDFSIETAEEALVQVETWLKQQQVKYFELTLPPFSLGQAGQVWVNILLRKGFQLKQSDLNYAIPIKNLPFEEQVNRACLKKLKQIVAANLTVRELTLPEFEKAHLLIVQNRERKGRRLSMNWESTWQMQQAFPEKFRMMGAFEGDELRAAAIFLLLNDETLYVFAWGDDGVLNHLTPTTWLAKHLYEYCQQHHFRYLDLGISTEAGMPNLGLANYKLSLGAEASLKLTMSKHYD